MRLFIFCMRMKGFGAYTYECSAAMPGLTRATTKDQNNKALAKTKEIRNATVVVVRWGCPTTDP